MRVRILIIVAIVFINILYSSILVGRYYFTKQSEISGVARIVPEVQDRVISFLDSLEEEKLIQYNFFYIKERLIGNNILNIKVKCNKIDKYIFLYNIINFLKENGVKEYSGFEYSNKILMNFFESNKKIIELDIKKN